MGWVGTFGRNDRSHKDGEVYTVYNIQPYLWISKNRIMDIQKIE